MRRRQLLRDSSLAVGFVACMVGVLPVIAEEGQEAQIRAVEETSQAKRPRQELQPLPDLTDAAALHIAASTGDLEAIRREVKAGTDIDLPLRPPGDGCVNASPLHVASAYGQLEAVGVLLELGADVRSATELGGTALSAAAMYGNAEIAAVLLEAGAPVDQANHQGFTPLLVAVDYGRVPIVRLLLDAGADLEAREEEFQRTALLRAAFWDSPETADLLLQAGADRSAVTKRGYGALELAARCASYDVLSFLLEEGFDPVSADCETPIIYHAAVAEFDSARKVETLLEHGCDVNAKNHNGFTPLVAAVSAGNEDAARLLIEAKADVRALDDDGCSALFWAAEGGSLGCVHLLIESGADVMQEERRSYTALHVAASSGHLEVLAYLLDAELAVDLPDENEFTPLMHAAFRSQKDAARLLLDRGASLNARDEWGRTALMLAAEEADDETVALLLDRGADLMSLDDEGWRAMDYARSRELSLERKKILLRFRDALEPEGEDDPF